ncbi:MAG: exo-alpha-sialidase [Bacteroidales bacterium]|nr:exo-alpha-sialidase [Bacteroidales bacterium]
MKTFLLSVAFLFAATLTMAQWEPDVRLTNDPGAGRTSLNNAWCIAASGDTVHVVWQDDRTGVEQTYYKRSTDGGITWGEDTRLSNTTVYAGDPTIAVSGSFVNVLWHGGVLYDFMLYYTRSTDGGTTWDPVTQLTNWPDAHTIYPSMAVSGSVVHVPWQDNRDGNGGNEIYYKRSADEGITWGDDVRLSNDPNYSGLPSVAAAGSDVHIVWEDDRDGPNGEGSVYYKRSTDGGITWGDDTPLTNSSADAWDPSVAVSDSEVHVVYYDWAWNEIFYIHSTDGGATWQSAQQLTNATGFSKYPSIAVSGSFVHVTWEDTRDGNFEIYYKRSTDGGVTWEPDVRLTNAMYNSLLTSVAVSDSVVHVVWTDKRDFNDEIYYKRNPTGNVITPTWTIEQNISQNQLVISPNPASSYLNINFKSPTSSNVVVNLINMSGQTIMTREFAISEGMNHVSLNLTDISDGIYSLVLTNENQRYISRVVVMN